MNGKLIAMRNNDSKGTVMNSSAEIVSITLKDIDKWNIPEFQRGIHDNKISDEVTASIVANGGDIPGVITIGLFDRKEWLVDGLQRSSCAKKSGLAAFRAIVRYVKCSSMEEMSKEFVRLNSHIARMKPDDILRAAETHVEAVSEIRRRCKIVGYCETKGKQKTTVSMSKVLRSWACATKETPAARGLAANGLAIAKHLNEDRTQLSHLIRFMNIATDSWGRDPEYSRLWGGLNMTLCMWLYQRVVMAKPQSGKCKQLTDSEFSDCMMALSADSAYLKWLRGRNMGEEHRTPAYNKVKAVFVTCLNGTTGRRHSLPIPTWKSSNGKEDVLIS